MNLFDKLALRRLIMSIINLLNRLLNRKEDKPEIAPNHPRPLKKVIDKIFNEEDQAKTLPTIKSKPKKRGKS